MIKPITTLISLLAVGTLSLAQQAPTTQANDAKPASSASDNPVTMPMLQHRRCGTSLNLERIKGEPTRAVSASGNYVPHNGTVTIPVILANYSDVKFTVDHPKAAFEQFFNGTTQKELGNGNSSNHGSVAQYFSDMSSGTFTPTFKILGPVTLNHNMRYYGGNQANSNADERTSEMVNDAINALQASDEKLTDVSPFCSDGQSIDCVYVIYAGRGQNAGGPDSSVWACTISFSPYQWLGKPVRWASMGSELFHINHHDYISGIGVTVHELSHAMGLPDFYPLNSSSYLDDQEMEYWDLMDGGEYAGNGYCPAPYTAFEKKEMGWPVDIQELTDNQKITMTTPTSDGGTAYKIVNPNNANEYIMLELIRQTGWNTEAYGNGLMAYHVNRPSANIGIYDQYNQVPGFPGMAIIPADSLCMSSYLASDATSYFNSLAGDLFPGTGNMDNLNVTILSDSNPRPNFCWYNTNFSWYNKSANSKLATNRALGDIAYDSATNVLTFNFYTHDVTNAISSVNNHDNGKHAIYTLDGRYAGTSLQALPHGIYITEGRKIIK